MRAKTLAIFFLLIFSTFLVAPSLIKIIEGKSDVSYFFNVSEEEKKSNEQETHDTFIFHFDQYYSYSHFYTETTNNFYFKNNFYHCIVIDKNSPPPKIIS